MALTHLLLIGAALLSLTFFSGSALAGEVGVCYGMLASHLMQPPAVVQLLKNNGITKVRLYNADAGALRALANTGIKVAVSLPNPNLVEAAGTMSYAVEWVKNNVMAYPGTLIDSVAVGNEVFHQAPELTPQLLPAMKNIQAALASVGLANAVKVFTPIAMDALKVPSWPPSVGEFRDDLAQSVMGPMIDFLDQTGSHLSFNIYPYFAYKEDPKIDVDYVLFRPNKGQTDKVTGLIYYNMFDAMLDAVFHAEEKLRNSLGHARGRMLEASDSSATIHETGGEAKVGSTNHTVTGQMSAAPAGWDAQAYNSNLISKVLRGTGTPYRPNADINVYIFSLFNEDLKPNEEERNFGLFYPDGTPVYKVDFQHPGPSPGPGTSWCVANAAVGDKRLQDALDYACGIGQADCSAIQPGGRCFDPDTKVAHASYAFNDYYQRNGRSDQSCDFGGCGSVVHQQPKFGNCVL
ncbi:glucan endo-1,3-beta-glucosidase 13-like isoform X2 [Lolium perenne]|uniref:glucan endo-1,3-beta-glucosidase 13-like isoform X2 n=1 Tax=Lolium perenne TaxID=4522 RepID=UPI0021F53533|nr:glucan endo-1,3-beta-glucosidase 13-like isoform X2 [Lolium perenne]